MQDPTESAADRQPQERDEVDEPRNVPVGDGIPPTPPTQPQEPATLGKAEVADEPPQEPAARSCRTDVYPLPQVAGGKRLVSEIELGDGTRLVVVETLAGGSVGTAAVVVQS